MINTFSATDLEIFQNLIGTQWSFVAGPELWEYLSSDLIFVICGELRISLQGDIFESTFESFKSDYSKIIVSSPKQHEIDLSIKKGFAYSFHAGDFVTGVSILRDSVQRTGTGIDTWDYISDSGVIFHLTSGDVAITKLGHHDEMLQVTFLDKVETAQIPEMNSHFEHDLDNQYRFNRELIPLQALN